MGKFMYDQDRADLIKQVLELDHIVGLYTRT